MRDTRHPVGTATPHMASYVAAEKASALVAGVAPAKFSQ